MKLGKRKEGVTAKEGAKRFNVSVWTIQKYTSIPRDEYLANSLSRSKPWESEGISRATWYRRNKISASQ
jgi:hypothetical protein